jgi:putative colanic acid biosynthesis acetyltransferase WcaF
MVSFLTAQGRPGIQNMALTLQHYRNRHSASSKLRRLTWNVVWTLLFRTTPRGLLYGWRRFLLRLFGAHIGNGANVLPTCRIWDPANLQLGDHSCLSEDVDCYCVDQIIIGAHVVVSQSAFLCTASHDITSPIMELTHAPIHLHDQSWIAARAFVAPGCVIGEGAVVGACSVVTRDVPPWTVVAGNPARAVGRRTLSKRIN